MRVHDDELGAKMAQADAEHVRKPVEGNILGGEGGEPCDELVSDKGHGIGLERTGFLFQSALEALVDLGVILEIGCVDALQFDEPYLDELRGASIGHVGRPPFPI